VRKYWRPSGSGVKYSPEIGRMCRPDTGLRKVHDQVSPRHALNSVHTGLPRSASQKHRHNFARQVLNPKHARPVASTTTVHLPSRAERCTTKKSRPFGNESHSNSNFALCSFIGMCARQLLLTFDSCLSTWLLLKSPSARNPETPHQSTPVIDRPIFATRGAELQ